MAVFFFNAALVKSAASLFDVFLIAVAFFLDDFLNIFKLSRANQSVSRAFLVLSQGKWIFVFVFRVAQVLRSYKNR